MKMSGPAPMSPSTSPDSSMNPGGSASAHAGMVSGEGGHLNTGSHKATSGGLSSSSDPLQASGMGVDPLQGLGTHGQQLRHGSVFHQVPVAAQEPGKLEAVDRVATQLPRLECRQVLRF